MSLAPLSPRCPLCWHNNQLKGGQVLWDGETMFAYSFRNEAGEFSYAMIVPKDHHANSLTLPQGWGEEFNWCYEAILGALNNSSSQSNTVPHNGYWNEGFTAGQRIMGHWHVRVEPRLAGQPASSMGLALLMATYNQAMQRIASIAEDCTDPATTAALHAFLRAN